MKQTAINYIKQNAPVESLQVRVSPELKKEIEEAAKKLDTTLNRFVEAATRCYLDQLKKEGSI